MKHLLNHRITVFCGNFGSGKTELSVNAALQAAQSGPVTLVDMDIVNPYFRSSEQRELLERHGVRVISPNYAGTNVDVPSLPAQIKSVFDRPDGKVIIDVGGDEVGAVALGGYKKELDADDTCMYMVVNAYRPFTSTAEDICLMAEQIGQRARRSIDALINNSNLGLQTTLDDVEKSRATVEEAAKRLEIEVVAVTAEEASLPADGTLICTVMKPEWYYE